jgi:hypothetical protein
MIKVVTCCTKPILFAMKNLIPMLFVVMILATGCPQPEPEIHQVEIGLFTPYNFFPETLNGKVKTVIERNFLGVEQDGKIIKGERLTVAARDTIGWTNDFSLTYDEDGNLIESALIDENDEVIDSNQLTVEEGKIVKSVYTKNDTVRNYALLSYDEAGHLVKVEQFRMPADTLAWSAQLLSDDQGNFLEWRFMDYKGDPTTKYIFTVNQDGRRTGYTFYNKEGEKAFEQQYTYNDMGYMSRQVLIDKEGKEYVSEYEYEYDEMNNWIKTIGKTSYGPTVVEERTITYFE